jgi:hypothetical protein
MPSAELCVMWAVRRGLDCAYLPGSTLRTGPCLSAVVRAALVRRALSCSCMLIAELRPYAGDFALKILACLSLKLPLWLHACVPPRHALASRGRRVFVVSGSRRAELGLVPCHRAPRLRSSAWVGSVGVSNDAGHRAARWRAPRRRSRSSGSESPSTMQAVKGGRVEDED